MRRILGLFGWTLLMTLAAGAQDPADPPARVARLRTVEGKVSLRAATSADWVAAMVNYPLTTGDQLWSAEDGYAEVYIGAAAIHLAQRTALTVTLLDDTVARISVTEGTAYLRIPKLAAGESFQVDTPDGSIMLRAGGAYRIDIDAGNRATSLRVRAGLAGVASRGLTTEVHAGQMAQFAAEREPAGLADAPAADDWEQACAARDEWAEKSLAASDAYVPEDMDGAEDLAANGDWTSDGEYGAVWSPSRVADGWAPYRDGHWATVQPWGLTWIDNAKWGFAPFHYGRWIYTGNRWLWVPGNRDRRPVYAPALVVFSGGRPRPTSWIPLAPGEPYRPSNPTTPRYLHRVNAASAPAEKSHEGYRNRAQVIVAPAAPNRPERRAEPAQNATEPRRPIVEQREAAPAQAEHLFETAPAEQPRVEQRRAEAQRAVEQRRTEEQRAEQQRRSEEQHAEQQRRFDGQRRAEEQRMEQQRRAEEQRHAEQRAAEQRAEQQRAEQHAEQQRAEQRASESRAAEQRAAEQHRAEEAKKAEDAKKKQ